MKNEIGGYFELELPKRGHFIHDDGILLNSGRSALEYIILSYQPIERIWIPFYTCSVVIELIERLNITISYYNIDTDLDICTDIMVGEKDMLLYTNYFGIKDDYVQTLIEKYGERLIVDCAQAWFTPISLKANYIYSPRKYVGIPDGGVAYCLKNKKINVPSDFSSDRCSHLLKRIDSDASEGYEDFRNNSRKISIAGLKKMSALTHYLLQSINFDKVREIRWQNFTILHNFLKDYNNYTIPSFNSFSCPMIYPFWPSRKGLKEHLINRKIYVATYWPNVLESISNDKIEYRLADEIVCLPIDQRYNREDMLRIIKEFELWK